MSTDEGQQDAYIQLPSVEEAEAARPPEHPYNFGFVGTMGRLLMAHPRIGPAFQECFAEIMFAPSPPSQLDRQERELIASVAASAQTCFY